MEMEAPFDGLLAVHSLVLILKHQEIRALPYLKNVEH